jgi:signal transduction histidine kinase
MSTQLANVLSSTELSARILSALPAGGVPLLVLRMPPGSRAVERATTDAFARGAARAVRDGDQLAHDEGSDWFAIAMLAPARNGRAISLDVRSAVERIGATMSLVTGTRIETGWWPIESLDDLQRLERTVERALERGARERERLEFLATVGHELRTPLTSIRGYLETVLDDELDAATTRRFLEVARNEALRLGRLVEGILDFSPLDLSSRPGYGSTDLSGALAAAADALAPIAHEAAISIRVEERGYAPARIAHDACMHVLLNVMENAIKYGKPGGTVLADIERQDPYLCVTIDDDGPGIAPGDRERIFAHRARGAHAGMQRGSGLGLAIVRTILERAAGSVAALESPLGGARFVMRFPVERAESQAPTS